MRKHTVQYKTTTQHPLCWIFSIRMQIYWLMSHLKIIIIKFLWFHIHHQLTTHFSPTFYWLLWDKSCLYSLSPTCPLPSSLELTLNKQWPRNCFCQQSQLTNTMPLCNLEKGAPLDGWITNSCAFHMDGAGCREYFTTTHYSSKHLGIRDKQHIYSSPASHHLQWLLGSESYRPTLSPYFTCNISNIYQSWLIPPLWNTFFTTQSLLILLTGSSLLHEISRTY